jgi:hypothetical protein
VGLLTKEQKGYVMIELQSWAIFSLGFFIGALAMFLTIELFHLYCTEKKMKGNRLQ